MQLLPLQKYDIFYQFLTRFISVRKLFEDKKKPSLCGRVASPVKTLMVKTEPPVYQGINLFLHLN